MMGGTILVIVVYECGYVSKELIIYYECCRNKSGFWRLLRWPRKKLHYNRNDCI